MSTQMVKHQDKIKELIIEQLRKTPIVQISCERSGISRATYYRWRKNDPGFAKASDEALLEGSLLINDMAESQLIAAIRDKNMTGIIFWLKHHHPTYVKKGEVITGHKLHSLSEEKIDELINMLYSKSTFRQGQTLFTQYVAKGLISEPMAELILKIFVSQLRAEDILTRKAEADVMTEILMRKRKKKPYER